jgi:sulfatase maturation enzyme AslB (radical SAM superfamily)
MSRNASFCVLPWIHMNLNPDGKATLCCQSHLPIMDESGRPLNGQTHSMVEIWNSPGMKDIRRRMATGEQLPHCDACFNNERYGRDSYRLQSNRHWLSDHQKAESIRATIEETADGAVARSPVYFDLRLGNICNLKCTACKPLYSSQIERDPVHSKWVIDAPYTRLQSRFGPDTDWSEADGLLDEIVTMSDNLAAIQLAGGEPTINKTQIALLKALCDNGRAAEIDLVVVTNLNNVRQDIYAIFAKFKSLSIGLSIDGCEAAYEYVRFPGKWSSLTKNIARLRSTCPDVRISINAVLQAINGYNLIDLLEWADVAGISINISIGRGLDHYNDLRILPRKVRDELRARFNAYFAKKGNRDISSLRQSVDSIFAETEATDFSDEVRRLNVLSFMHFVNDLDKSRGLSFRTIAPQIYRGIVEYYGHWDSGTRYA